jgi:hypothetical protein
MMEKITGVMISPGIADVTNPQARGAAIGFMISD